MAAVINTSPHVHEGYGLIPVALAVTLSVAYLMVSTVEFASIKSFKITGVKMRVRLLIGTVIVLVWKDPGLGLLILSGVYVLSGPFSVVRPYLPRWLGGGHIRMSGKADVSGDTSASVANYKVGK
jgi:phosphatidylserine synthase